MVARTRKCWMFCVWSAVLLMISTEDFSLAQISQQSPSEDQALSYFYQQSEFPRDCAEVVRRCPSKNATSIHSIKPDGYHGVFDAYCDNHGYTIISRRVNGIIGFGRSWEDYTSGFGFLSNEFWIGNHRLSYLTNQKRYELLIEVTLNDGSTINATYDEFRISDAYSNYELINTGQFSVEGGYCYWDPWTACSVTCDEGVKRRNCHCTDGSACAGVTVEEAACHEVECPAVNGVWSRWTTWTQCPVTCGGGQQVRERECNNPAPRHGGQDCAGKARQSRRCSTNECPVDGVWASWGSWTQCPVTCGGGQQVRERECNNPAPRHGGHDCTGNARQSRRCSTDACPVLDCQDIYDSGQTASGLYYINPAGSQSRIRVYCNMSDGGGWTVIQRHYLSSSPQDFNQNWLAYRNGFGEPSEELWIGNEKLFLLTNLAEYELRIDMVQRGSHRQFYAKYDLFRITGENDKYRLSELGTFSGTAGYDALRARDGSDEESLNMYFSTPDRDNDRYSGWFYHLGNGCSSADSCAACYRGGWWYNDCQHFNPNLGIEAPYCVDCVGFWHNLPDGIDLIYTEMKIRPRVANQ